MTHDDGLEALLAEHQWDITRNTPHCNCGELAYSITTHQAAVVRAAGWRKVIPLVEGGIQGSLDYDEEEA